jgi:thymidine phosphorylase
VERGEPLCTLHYNSDARLGEARRLAETAYRIELEKPNSLPPLIYKVIGAQEI